VKATRGWDFRGLALQSHQSSDRARDNRARTKHGVRHKQSLQFDSDESSNLWTQFEGRCCLAGITWYRTGCKRRSQSRMPRLRAGSQVSGIILFYRGGIGAGPEKILNNSISSASRGVSSMAWVNSSGSKGLASSPTLGKTCGGMLRPVPAISSPCFCQRGLFLPQFSQQRHLP
jgi:hypothetical protein